MILFHLDEFGKINAKYTLKKKSEASKNVVKYLATVVNLNTI
jgi:hypothetical protein